MIGGINMEGHDMIAATAVIVAVIGALLGIIWRSITSRFTTIADEIKATRAEHVTQNDCATRHNSFKDIVCQKIDSLKHEFDATLERRLNPIERSLGKLTNGGAVQSNAKRLDHIEQHVASLADLVHSQITSKGTKP